MPSSLKVMPGRTYSLCLLECSLLCDEIVNFGFSESLEAVQEKVDAKRISVGSLKFKHTTFDASANRVKVKTDKKSDPNKKRGINKVNVKLSVVILKKYAVYVLSS